MAEVLVTGLGLVSALGSNVATAWTRLLKGETAIALRQPLPELSVLPLAMIGKQPAHLTGMLSEAVTAALLDARLSPPLPDCGVVVGSSRSHQAVLEGFAQDWIRWQQSPTEWMAVLPHMSAMVTARQVGSLGPVRAPMAACATGLMAIFQGAELIQQGECDRVVVAAADAPITPLTLAGFERMGALSHTGCYPFSQERSGLVLGEGAAALVLESARLAHQRQAVVYGQILGAGLSADGHHVSAPDPSRRGSQRAILQCLQRSQLTPAEIDYIHAHGTGTPLNDAHEAALIQELFPNGPPVSSTKGATGHTLGASGALGAIFCLLALKFQQLPPTVGVGTAIAPINLVRQSSPALIETALCLSFGFGGQNVTLAISRTADRSQRVPPKFG